jgi:signal peptidase I
VAVQNFRVDGVSMTPTLHNNEFVLVDKLTYDFVSPQRGDIVVFKYPVQPWKDYIKRIIAVPGDRVTIHDGGVYVNGRRLVESYIRNPYPRNYSLPTIPFRGSDVVPPGNYFVLGDNRDNSADSRFWGLLPRRDIIGRALLAYWPLQRFGLLTDPSTSAASGTKGGT